MISAKHIAPLRRADLPELSQFLESGFGASADACCFSPEVLAWKYFDGPGGRSMAPVRSLIARSAGSIVGHIGICFRPLIVSGEAAAPVSSMHAIDWLASAAHPGLGALLMLEALATTKTQFAVGGTSRAQALFPRFGFERKSKVSVFRKILAPLHRMHAAGCGSFRKWAATTRDVAYFSVARTRTARRTVELRPANTFSAEIDGLLRRSTLRMVMCERDHLLLNYLLRYPRPEFSGWTIHAAGRTIGFAVLKITPSGRTQLGRIVDCWLDTDDPSCWRSAVAALVDRLRALSAGDVTCYATLPSLRAALRRNGFFKSGRRSVYVRDKQQLLPQDLPLGLSEFDADGALL